MRIYLSPPHICGTERLYIERAFESNWVVPLGPNVDQFETAVARLVGVGHAVSLSSGTAAIHLALKSLGVGPGDTVLCSDATFSASCNPVTYLDATPAFVDCDQDTWCMCPDALETALSNSAASGKMPKAVVAVDLYGLPADYGRIKPLCERYGVPIVEDAAEALGSQYGGRPCGGFGEFGILSFNGNKIITTSGGGMLLTDDGAAAAKVKFWATQAREPGLSYYEHREIGYNYRLSNICAGIGLGQVESLPLFLERRRRNYEYYASRLGGRLCVGFYPDRQGIRPNHWLTVMVIDPSTGKRPDDVIAALAAHGIESRRFWKPMHLQPVFRGCAFYPSPSAAAAARVRVSGEPCASVGEELFERAVCLPSGSALTEPQLDEIAGAVESCFL